MPQRCPCCGKLLDGKQPLRALTQEEIDRLKEQAATPPDGKIYVKRDDAERNINAYNEMVNSGYAPSGKRIISIEEYKDLTESSQLHDYWSEERTKLRNTPIYRYTEKRTWSFYTGTALVGIFMVTGLVYLLGWIIPFILKSSDKATSPDEVVKIVRDSKTGKYGLYNSEHDSLVIPYQYDTIFHRKGYNSQRIPFNLFYLHKNEKFAVADSLGRITVNCELDSTSWAYDNLLIMYKGRKRGVLDYNCCPIVPCNYQYVLWETKPREDLYNVGKYVGNIIPVKADNNSGWELYNRKGVRICDKKYHKAIQTGSPELIKVCERVRVGVRNSYTYEEKYGVVNENGQEVIPCKYYGISKFGDDRAWVQEKEGGAWSLIASTGKLIKSNLLQSTYTPYAFSEGLAAVKAPNGKIGYYDVSGNLAQQFKYMNR